MKLCAKSAMKVIVPPIECELSYSIGTFLNNYDAINRKLKLFVIYSTVWNQTKWGRNATMETTKKQQ